MGKRQLGEMQPFELVITLLIADLATAPLTDTTIPIFYGIIPIIVLCFMHFAISFIARKSIIMRKVISGKPMIAITPDGIDYETLKKLNININDLIEAVRGTNVFHLEDVKYGIFETNGSFYSMTNDEPCFERGLPAIIISDGRLNPENMKMRCIEESVVMGILSGNNIKNLNNVIILTLDELGNMYLQEKGEKYITAQNVCSVGGA